MNKTRLIISSECRLVKMESAVDHDFEFHVKIRTCEKIWHTALITWYAIEDAINAEMGNK